VSPKFKAFLKDWLPPAATRGISQALALRRPNTPTEVPKRKVIRTLRELDAEIVRGELLQRTSNEAFFEFLDSFRYEPDLPPGPEDPFSQEYREAQEELYRHISGRSEYDPGRDEKTEAFDIEHHVTCPFPYTTKICRMVGNRLMMEGFLVAHLNLAADSRILEFGPGWGSTTMHLALTGLNVSVVEIFPDFVELIRRRAEHSRVEVKCHPCAMLDFKTDEPYDAVLFFECFHHCSDHMQMLRNLHGMIKDDGIVIFAGEPIVAQPNEFVPKPWSIRLDSQTVWCVRKYGWLEYGFTQGYFLEALRRTGWTSEVHWSQDVPNNSVILARRAK
jgi:cyclopropane fatty-acyl-phospholipid synthase-like methyltransferase